MRYRRTWLVPALIALILFLGGVASNLIAGDLQPIVARYRAWAWVLFIVALIVAVGAAVWDWRPPRGRATQSAPLRRRIQRPAT